MCSSTTTLRCNYLGVGHDSSYRRANLGTVTGEIAVGWIQEIASDQVLKEAGGFFLAAGAPPPLHPGFRSVRDRYAVSLVIRTLDTEVLVHLRGEVSQTVVEEAADEFFPFTGRLKKILVQDYWAKRLW